MGLSGPLITTVNVTMVVLVRNFSLDMVMTCHDCRDVASQSAALVGQAACQCSSRGPSGANACPAAEKG